MAVLCFGKPYVAFAVFSTTLSCKKNIVPSVDRSWDYVKKGCEHEYTASTDDFVGFKYIFVVASSGCCSTEINVY